MKLYEIGMFTTSLCWNKTNTTAINIFRKEKQNETISRWKKYTTQSVNKCYAVWVINKWIF